MGRGISCSSSSVFLEGLPQKTACVFAYRTSSSLLAQSVFRLMLRLRIHCGVSKIRGESCRHVLPCLRSLGWLSDNSNPNAYDDVFALCTIQAPSFARSNEAHKFSRSCQATIVQKSPNDDAAKYVQMLPTKDTSWIAVLNPRPGTKSEPDCRCPETSRLHILLIYASNAWV